MTSKCRMSDRSSDSTSPSYTQTDVLYTQHGDMQTFEHIRYACLHVRCAGSIYIYIFFAHTHGQHLLHVPTYSTHISDIYHTYQQHMQHILPTYSTNIDNICQCSHLRSTRASLKWQGRKQRGTSATSRDCTERSARFSKKMTSYTSAVNAQTCPPSMFENVGPTPRRRPHAIP